MIEFLWGLRRRYNPFAGGAWSHEVVMVEGLHVRCWEVGGNITPVCVVSDRGQGGWD